MRRKRMFGHDFHPRACTGEMSPRGFRKNGNLENVVVIDVDCDPDTDPDVVIVDAPDSLEPDLRGSGASRQEREFPFDEIISIDDEDSDIDHPGVGVPGVDELDSDATSSKRSHPSPEIPRNSSDCDVDQFYTVQEEKSTSKLPKRQKSHDDQTPSRSRYGLSPDLEDGSSGSDCSDCEVLEGSSEELREQWEKTYSKRKQKSFDCSHGVGDHASTSTFHAGAHVNGGAEYREGFCFKDPMFSSSSNKNVGKKPSRGNGDHSDFRHSEDARETGRCERDHGNYWLRSQKKGRAQFVPRNGNVHVGEETYTSRGPGHVQQKNSYDNSMNFPNDDEGPRGAFRRFNVMGGENYWSRSQKKGRAQFVPRNGNVHVGEGTYTNRGAGHVQQKSNTEATCRSSSQSENCDDEESGSHKSQVSGDENAPERVVLREHDNVTFQKEFSGSSSLRNDSFHEKDVSFEEERLRDESFQKVRSSKGTDATNGETDKGDLLGKSSTKCNPEASREEPHEKPENHVEGSYPVKRVDPFVGSTSKTQSNEGRDGDCSTVMQDTIINGREKLKETDEYRRAQEEEWASRQQQLQQQAEEARRLRKKKKAETQRKIDMEMRQKQRVEEMRKTQKEDEENMNLKEKLRAEIRKELLKLEVSCFDMPSILRGLGIHVASSAAPVSAEVHSACKRALYTFHPDRASRNDIRQQVEAEEKFKLISRMKEKYLLTSCH